MIVFLRKVKVYGTTNEPCGIFGRESAATLLRYIEGL